MAQRQPSEEAITFSIGATRAPGHLLAQQFPNMLDEVQGPVRGRTTPHVSLWTGGE